MWPRPAGCIRLAGPAWGRLGRLSGLGRLSWPGREPSPSGGQAGPEAVCLWGRARGRAAATHRVRELRGARRGGTRRESWVRSHSRDVRKREGGQDGGDQLAG